MKYIYRLSFILACFLLAIALRIWIYLNRQIKRKNRTLAVHIRELQHEQELSREMQLFRKLNALMENEKPFISPELDRPALARLLGTNEKYLADAVQEGARTTVASYISDCRLACSLSLFTEKPHLSMDMIAEKSGYGSYSAFFRAFTKKYGMAPSEYRRLLKN